jgi:hypothetical protein
MAKYLTLSRNWGVCALSHATTDCTLAAGGEHEFLNAPTGSVFDQVADGQGVELDRQVSLGGFAKAAEPVVRAGIDRANCVVDATNIKRLECPSERPEQPPRVTAFGLG